MFQREAHTTHTPGDTPGCSPAEAFLGDDQADQHLQAVGPAVAGIAAFGLDNFRVVQSRSRLYEEAFVKTSGRCSGTELVRALGAAFPAALGVRNAAPR